MAGIGSGLGILLTLCRGCAGLCTGLYVRLYAMFMLFDYAKSCKYNQKLNTFDYASFMRFLPMRRMFQVLLYAGFMQHFYLIHFFSITYSSMM